jgi:hypothetical protein
VHIVRCAHPRATLTGERGSSAEATDRILDGQDDGHTLPPPLQAPAYHLALCTQPLFLHLTPHPAHQPHAEPEPEHRTVTDAYLFIRKPHTNDNKLFDSQDESVSVNVYASARPQGTNDGALRSEEECDEADDVRAHGYAGGGASQGEGRW